MPRDVNPDLSSLVDVESSIPPPHSSSAVVMTDVAPATVKQTPTLSAYRQKTNHSCQGTLSSDTPCMVSALPPPVAGAAPSFPQPCVEACRSAPVSTASNKQPPGGSFLTLHYSLRKMLRLRKMKMCATVAFSQFCTPSRGLVLISGGNSSVASRRKSFLKRFEIVFL